MNGTLERFVIWVRARRAVPRQNGKGYLIGLLVIVVVGLWLLPLGSSFWLDETVTTWVIQGGFGQTWHRATTFQHSPVYFLLAWVVKNVLGASEAALRAPSLLAMGLAMALVYRLGRRLFGSEVGLTACIVLAGLRAPAFAACDARPYALAILSVVASVFLLIQWFETGKVQYGIGYAFCTALTDHVHVLFSIMLLVHAGYSLVRLRSSSAVSHGQLWWVAALLMILHVPAAAAMLTLSGQGASLSWASRPPVGIVLNVIGLPVALCGLILLFARRSGWAFGRPSAAASVIVLIGSWAIVPPLVLWLVSACTGWGVFQGRYYASSGPGLALLAAAAVGLVPAARLRRALVTAAAAVSLLAGLQPVHTPEDWRGALAAAGRVASGTGVPVLIRSNLVEGRRPDWLLPGTERHSYLLAPLSAYRLDAPALALPYNVGTPAAEYVERLAASRLAGRQRFVLVTCHYGAAYQDWLQRRVSRFSFRPAAVRDFGDIRLVVFVRQTSGGTGVSGRVAGAG